MKNIFLSMGLLVFILGDSAFAAETINTNFIDRDGTTIGNAVLTQTGGGTLISVDVDLPPGAHAVHIHEGEKCELPDFKTAGGHFNPTHHQHGLISQQGFHAGDLPNIYVESTHHIKFDVFSAQLHLTGNDGLEKGAAIVIHENGDDYMTDPSGNAGNRIACAVIKN